MPTGHGPLTLPGPNPLPSPPGDVLKWVALPCPAAGAAMRPLSPSFHLPSLWARTPAPLPPSSAIFLRGYPLQITCLTGPYAGYYQEDPSLVAWPTTPNHQFPSPMTGTLLLLPSPQDGHLVLAPPHTRYLATALPECSPAMLSLRECPPRWVPSHSSSSLPAVGTLPRLSSGM